MSILWVFEEIANNLLEEEHWSVWEERIDIAFPKGDFFSHIFNPIFLTNWQNIQKLYIAYKSYLEKNGLTSYAFFLLKWQNENKNFKQIPYNELVIVGNCFFTPLEKKQLMLHQSWIPCTNIEVNSAFLSKQVTWKDFQIKKLPSKISKYECISHWTAMKVCWQKVDDQSAIIIPNHPDFPTDVLFRKWPKNLPMASCFRSLCWKNTVAFDFLFKGFNWLYVWNNEIDFFRRKKALKDWLDFSVWEEEEKIVWKKLLQEKKAKKEWWNLLNWKIEGSLFSIGYFLLSRLKKKPQDISYWEAGIEIGDEWLEETAFLKKEVNPCHNFLYHLKEEGKKRKISIDSKGDNTIPVLTLAETEGLSFKKLFFLGFQDHFFPSMHIKYERFKVGENDAISSQNIEKAKFLTLIKEASEISFFYSSPSYPQYRGKSSWLLELEENPNTTSYYFHYGAINLIRTRFKIQVSKKQNNRLLTDIFLSKEDGGSAIPLTPSGFYTYKLCSLRFYFQYILRLPYEKKNPIWEPMGIGKLFHQAMKEFYLPLVGKEITASIIEERKKNINKIQKLVLDPYLLSQGRYKWILFLLETYMDAILLKDKNMAPFTLEAVEKSLLYNWKSSKHTFVLGGIVDRCVESNGYILVTDYKIKIPTFSFLSWESVWKKALDFYPVIQSYWYTFLWAKYCNDDKKIFCPVLLTPHPSIYGKGFIFDKEEKKIISFFEEKEEAFCKGLNSFLEELCCEKVNFKATEDRYICSSCPFNKICNR